MSWILNVVVIGLCVGAVIEKSKQTNENVGWVNGETYQYIITALLVLAYGLWAYFLGNASSLFQGVHLGNTMAALALGIITLAKMIVEVKRSIDEMELEEEVVLFAEESVMELGILGDEVEYEGDFEEDAVEVDEE